MKKAIKVLEDKINECANMKVFFEKELQKNEHITADLTEVHRLKIGLQETIDIKEDCFKALAILTR